MLHCPAVGERCQDTQGAIGCTSILVPLVPRELILLLVPCSLVLLRAACQVPWCLPQGDARKVIMFLARRGCPPEDTALPTPAQACWCVPAWHNYS